MAAAPAVPTGATRTAQALALDAGLVPADRRAEVLDALVELVYAFHPNGTGPHFSGGTIGMRSTYATPQGTARSLWTRTDHRFTLDVTIPANTTAEIWLPAGSDRINAPRRATFLRTDGGHAVHSAPSGLHTFSARVEV